MRVFEEAQPGEWEAAAATTRQPNQWDTLLEQVRTGKTMRIPFPDDPEHMRGTRISVGRRATQLGISVEFQKAGDVLLVKQKAVTDGAISPAPAPNHSDQQAKPARRGRRAKTATVEQEYTPSREAAAADPEEVPVEEG